MTEGADARAPTNSSHWSLYRVQSESGAIGTTMSVRPLRIEVNDKMQRVYVHWLTEPMGQNFHSEFRPDLTPKQMLELRVVDQFRMPPQANPPPAIHPTAFGLPLPHLALQLLVFVHRSGS